MPSDVVMYCTPLCPYCIRAKALLQRKGVAFHEIDVSNDPEARTRLLRVTRQRTVPQIFINDHSIGGCDELYQLERQGRLDALLAEEPPGNNAQAAGS